MEYAVFISMLWIFILHMEVRKTNRLLSEIKNKLGNTENGSKQILKG
jgi:hypothetical protein